MGLGGRLLLSGGRVQVGPPVTGGREIEIGVPLPPRVAVGDQMQRIGCLEPLVSLVEVIPVAATTAERQCDDRRVILAPSLHGAHPIDELRQEIRRIGHRAADIRIVRPVSGVDVGLIDHITAHAVAQVVEPGRLRIADANRVESSSFQRLQLSLGRNGIRSRIVVGRRQRCPAAVDPQLPVAQLHVLEPEPQRDILDDTSVAARIEHQFVQRRSVGVQADFITW